MTIRLAALELCATIMLGARDGAEGRTVQRNKAFHSMRIEY